MDTQTVIDWLREGARNAAGAVMGTPGGYGDMTRAMLAAIRAPLRGTDYQTERQRIRADEGMSAVPDVEWAQQVEQMPYQGFTAPAAGHMLVHGTRSRWAPEPGAPLGQFRRSFKHSGEGSAYKGAGGYAAEAPPTGESYRVGTAEPELNFRNKAVEPSTPQQMQEAEMMLASLRDLFDEYKAIPNKERWLEEWKRGKQDVAEQHRAAAERARGWHEKRPEFAKEIAEYGETDLATVLEYEQRAAKTQELANWARNITGDDIDLAAGSLYALDFPDELMPRVMDFGSPISAQTPEVVAAVRRIPKLRETVEKYMRSDDLALSGRDPNERPPAIDPAAVDANIGKYTGEGIYHALVDAFGGQNDPAAPEAASRALADAGIPAHKFLDAASRESGEGTRNFVIYEPDKHLKTLARYDSLADMDAAVRGHASRGLLEGADRAEAKGMKGEAEWRRMQAKTFDLNRSHYESYFKTILDSLRGGKGQ